MIPFIKKYWHWLAIALLAFVVVLLYGRIQDNELVIKSKNSIIKEQNTEIEYRKSKEGKIIADKIAAEIRAEDLKEAYPKLAKLLTEQMDVRIKNLRTSIQAEFRAINSGASNIVRDTIFQQGEIVRVTDSISIDDGFLSIKGEVEPNIFRWNYQYQDSITIALHVKRKWLLGDEKLYSSVMLSNPNAKVINSTSVQVQEHRDKRWVISAGAYYDPFRNQWGFAINGGYALFKF